MDIDVLTRIIEKQKNDRLDILQGLKFYKKKYLQRDQIYRLSTNRKHTYRNYNFLRKKFYELEEEIKLLKQIRHNAISSERLAEEWEEFFGDI